MHSQNAVDFHQIFSIYIFQGNPLVELDGVRTRVGPLSCVTIPSLCPHRVINDTEQVSVPSFGPHIVINNTEQVNIPSLCPHRVINDTEQVNIPPCVLIE